LLYGDLHNPYELFLCKLYFSFAYCIRGLIWVDSDVPITEDKIHSSYPCGQIPYLYLNSSNTPCYFKEEDLTTLTHVLYRTLKVNEMIHISCKYLALKHVFSKM